MVTDKCADVACCKCRCELFFRSYGNSVFIAFVLHHCHKRGMVLPTTLCSFVPFHTLGTSHFPYIGSSFPSLAPCAQVSPFQGGYIETRGTQVGRGSERFKWNQMSLPWKNSMSAIYFSSQSQLSAVLHSCECPGRGCQLHSHLRSFHTNVMHAFRFTQTLTVSVISPEQQSFQSVFRVLLRITGAISAERSPLYYYAVIDICIY